MSDYSGFTFDQLYDLPLGAYLIIKRDSWIANMMQTDESRDILKRIYELQLTKIDMDAVRRFQDKGRS